MGRRAASTLTEVDPQRILVRERTRGGTLAFGFRRAVQAVKGAATFAGERSPPAERLPHSADAPDPEVTDDLAAFSAVLDSELAAIETYLGASIEELLGRPD